jgi:spore coat protein U-like protein
VVAALATLAVVALPSPALAACTISTTGLNFGDYSVYSSTPLDAAGTITYRCTGFTLVVLVTLSPGASGTYSARQMRRGSTADRLEYNLYLNATRTTIWGDGTSGTSRYVGWLPTSNRNVNLAVYGRIPALQDVTVGTYTDTVIATIEF